MIAEKLVRLYLLMNIKRITRTSTLKTNMARKRIDETRNCFLEEIKHNNLMSENNKKVCWDLNYFKHFPI